MANNLTPLYEDATHLPCKASANVTGKTCVDISGNRDSGPGLAATGATAGTYQVAPCAAGALAFGVAEFDALAGQMVTVARTPGMVVPITCSAAIAAGAEVEVGAGGTVIPHAAGIVIGRCLTGAANGADAEIALYR